MNGTKGMDVEHGIVDFFSPSFGNRPARFVGRGQTLESILGGLRTRPGSKDRATVIMGQRGYGKTVLLWEVADRAREMGFAVVNPTAVREGLVARIAEKLRDEGTRILGARKREITGGSVGALGFSAGVTTALAESVPRSPEGRLEHAVRDLSEKGVGTLILVDELQAGSAEVRSLVETYQELVGEGLDVAIALAGLPGAVSRTLNDRVLTFLNRARKLDLPPLATGEVDAFYRSAFAESGIEVPAELRRRASKATQGSPYLMQLIGHYVVLYADEAGRVGESALSEALKSAEGEFVNDVCETTLAALSAGDVAYLSAMAQAGGSGTCSTSEVAARLGVSASYGQQYRGRLLEAGVIIAPAHGFVQFAVPHLAEHLAKRIG